MSKKTVMKIALDKDWTHWASTSFLQNEGNGLDDP